MYKLATLIAGVAALCTFLPTTAAAGPGALKISGDPGTIVLEYGHADRTLTGQDPLPLIRIYGDGMAWVHYPVGTPRAGDYEFKLQPGELRELLRDIKRNGLLEFDRARTLRQRATMQATRDDPVSSATDTLIRIRLDRYRGQADFDKSIVWTDVAGDARAYPRLRPVQSLARLEQRLRGLIEQRELSPVELPLALR